MEKDSSEKIPVIAVVGPTASGKTSMAIKLASIFDAEIVSADSMQIYKGMDIASAKPDTEETQGIPYHLIDFLDADEKYSVARYVNDAARVIKKIRLRHKNVIICGGTGLYVDSLIDNIAFEEQSDNSEIREDLRKRKVKEGIRALYGELENIDIETARRLHINNENRILRALETYYLTGIPPSELRRRSRLEQSPYIPVFIGMDYSDREILYKRIEKRVDMMLEKGLVEEARKNLPLDFSSTFSQAIGYKEFVPYFEGKISLDKAVENLKRATRHYAKRQLTWFRKNRRINSIYLDKYGSFSEAVKAAAEIIENTGLFERRENSEKALR